MSATMAGQGGQVQLEQSNMRLALNMAKMTNERFLRATIEKTQYLIKKCRTAVREEMMRGVEFPGHTIVNAAIDGHPALLHHNHTARCLPCHNCTPKNPQRGRWRNGKSAPPPDRCRQPTPEPSRDLPGTPTALISDNSGVQRSQINNLLAGYVDSHTAHPCAEFFILDAYSQDSHQDTDFDTDMLPDERASTG